MSASRVLVAGATGYVGRLLVPRLLRAGYRVRVLARDPGQVSRQAWNGSVEVVRGDVLKPETLGRATAGVAAAYYLIHSMAEGPGFGRREALGARNFGTAARQGAVGRIVYLGGLGDPATRLSGHLQSRQQTGRVLSRSGVPVTEFRAAIIVGEGSASFEIIRHLTDRLPVMVCPRWIYTRTQPIAVRDVLSYLVRALAVPQSAGKTIEIGGADVLTYQEMIQGYARARGKRRLLIPAPVLSPRLSSYWVGLVTPIPGSVARPLIEGLRNEVVVRNDLARRLFPEIQPLGYPEALRLALGRRGGWRLLVDVA